MTASEMEAAGKFTDPMVQKLLAEYAALWDCCCDLIYTVTKTGADSEETSDQICKLERIIESQPN